jgi:lysophospholipid acyltransferase (LPLAT)-like uncharacterized protein
VKKPLKTYILGYLLLALVRLLRLTYRIRVFGADQRRAAEALHAHGSFCLALWHEYLFATIVAHVRQPFAPLASLSEDGELVTFVMDRVGFRTVRGSSSRGGEAARDGLVRSIADGYFTAVTVDGPRGPRRRVKGGVVDVARRTGVAVVPIVVAADRQWVLGSWDRFKIPKPFARIAVRYGAPVVVPAETSGLAFGDAKSAIRRTLEETEQTVFADLAAWGAGGGEATP